MKLECGGVGRADGEVLDGKLIRVNTSQVNGKVKINSPAGGETNQVRSTFVEPSCKASWVRGEVFTVRFHSPPFCLQLDMGYSILKPGVSRTLKTEVEKSFM